MAKSESSPPAADDCDAGFTDDRIGVELIRAWPRRFESIRIMLPAGATIAQALTLAGIALTPDPETADRSAEQSGDVEVVVAVFGERVDSDYVLSAGDRIELLRPLRADPKEARRKRANAKSSRE